MESSMETYKLSVRLLENLLMIRKFENKKEIQNLAQIMLSNVINSDYPEIIKEAYTLLIHNIDMMSFEEMMSLKTQLINR